MTDPLVGATVAHYKVLAKLGGGGMGVVYTAHDTRLGRHVALKFLPPQWSHDDSAKQRFLREAQAASATNHRNICTIHDIETAPDGQLFIVMAWYEGETLKQKLEAGALPVEEAVEIAAQIAEGLAKAHAEGIVHRDIKPGNLMLVDGDVKILDFGLAKFANALQLTLEGSTLGTVAYMSPEQTRGEEADARSDVWSLGVVLYEMLAGKLPFRGAYPEAVSHAIRNDPVPPIRRNAPDVPAPLLTILERALQKDSAGRYPSAREMARDLRLLQGRTIPLDLLTAPIHAPALQLPPRRRWWQSRAVAAAGVGVLLTGVATPFWLFAPTGRVSVVVAPVMNQTGYAELDSYRAALTAELIGELSDSPAIRVLPYERELEVLARFRTSGLDISSREALEALVAQSRASVVIVPALTYENGAWRARIEFRNAATATSANVVTTTAIVSSLMKDTAYSLMPEAAGLVDEYFIGAGPRRQFVAERVREYTPYRRGRPTRRTRTLDAAAAFERGVDAFAQMEYVAALSAFADASRQDSRNALLFAWKGLAAQVSRRDDIAAESADQAARLLTNQTPATDRSFIEAVAAEARRDAAGAEKRYREGVDRHPDDGAAMMRLAAFQDRQNQNANAVESYLAALARDPRLARPNIELCRMYNRLNEFARAKEFGQKALATYQNIADRNGEGQALFCLADALRAGSDADREVARRHAERATQIFEELGAQYNIARAYTYQALIAGMQGRRRDAVGFGEQALAEAQRAGNLVLQPLVLMNLGVTYENMGERARAANYYLQSAKLYESLGDEARAVQIQTNRANLLINFGGSSEEAVRDAQNALAVARKVGDAKFEVASLQIVAAADQNAGRLEDAERGLNRIVALAKERDLKDDLAESTVELARLRLEQGRYAESLDLLTQALGDGSGPVEPLALVVRGRILTRLGDLSGADAVLTAAAESAARRGENSILPLLETSRGQLAYESGKPDEARRYFQTAAAQWADTLPDPASVEATAYLGVLDATGEQVARGIAALSKSLEQARLMNRLALEIRCRVLFARINVQHGRREAALAVLRDVRDDAKRTVGPELQAQVHYWRAQALQGLGDQAGATREDNTARALANQLRTAVPERYRGTFHVLPEGGTSRLEDRPVRTASRLR